MSTSSESSVGAYLGWGVLVIIAVGAVALLMTGAPAEYDRSASEATTEPLVQSAEEPAAAPKPEVLDSAPEPTPTTPAE